MVTLDFPLPTAAHDEQFVSTIVDIVNRVYTETEGDIFIPEYRRTSKSEISQLIEAQSLAVAYSDDGVTPIGCVQVKQLSSTRGEFGMLALDPAFRGRGLGNRIIGFAEDQYRNIGYTAMQVTLLVPTTVEHAFKKRLEAWYLRKGFILFKAGSFIEDYPDLGSLLAGPAELRFYEKSLTT